MIYCQVYVIIFLYFFGGDDVARKAITNTLDEELYKDIRRLALEKDINANDLIEEGMRLILEKYRNEKEACKE